MCGWQVTVLLGCVGPGVRLQCGVIFMTLDHHGDQSWPGVSLYFLFVISFYCVSSAERNMKSFMIVVAVLVMAVVGIWRGLGCRQAACCMHERGMDEFKNSL